MLFIVGAGREYPLLPRRWFVLESPNASPLLAAGIHTFRSLQRRQARHCHAGSSSTTGMVRWPARC